MRGAGGGARGVGMTLRVWTPTEVALEAEVTRIKAESEDGWFGVLPRHVDFVTALVPSVVTYTAAEGGEAHVAVDRGVLVKCGRVVMISARNVVKGSLESLRGAVGEQFQQQRGKEQAAARFGAKLEADLVRRLMEMEQYGRR